MELCVRRCDAIPDVAPAQREAILRAPIDSASHARLQADLAALHAVEVADPPAPAAAPLREARVVAWNAARGGAPAEAAAMARAAGADVLLLTELDAGMARSAQRHAARDLALRLGMGFAYAVEFVELGLGTEAERARLPGARNERGLHGAAVASARPLERPALARLDAGGDWFDGRRGERRVGGRIAVLATLRLDGAPVTLASVHLESHGDPAHRDAQAAALLAAVDAYAPGAPVLLGGDFNTHSLGVRELEDRAALAGAVRADPGRFARPEPHEPLFARLAHAGFACAPCNAGGATHFTGERGANAGGLRLDWFFARGLAVRAPAILPTAREASGAPLSDHEAIALTIGLPG